MSPDGGRAGPGVDPSIRRSLALHAPLRRNPATMLADLAAWLPPGMPADGPDGPTAVLEARLAELLGKPAAMFFPSGTMAQQVALRLHADARASRTFAGHPATHVAVHEEQGYEFVHGLRFRPVGGAHRLITTADLGAVDEPLAAVTWELPQVDIGGQVPSWAELTEQVRLVRDRGAAAHLDGARLFETTTHYGRSAAQLAGLFDTVYVSLYKLFEAPRGAVLAGPAELIADAGVWRTRLGGTIPDAWPLTAAALMGLDRVLPRIDTYDHHAREIAEALAATSSATVVPDPPQAALFRVHLPVPAAAVEQAHTKLLERTGVQLMWGARSERDPGCCSFLVSVGENAMDFTPAEVAGLVEDLVADARCIADAASK